MNLHDIPKEIQGPKLFWVGTNYPCKICYLNNLTGHHACAELSLNVNTANSVWCECSCVGGSEHYHYTDTWELEAICAYCERDNHPQVGENHYE